MKNKIKLLLVLIMCLFIIVPQNVTAAKKVKVYMFEAGGCPYCEAEETYLKGLSSYGKKFELVKKELYVDHIDWERGKDFELGKKVAEAFLEAGFKDASYNGTPFVVISNIYAAAAYSDSLEKVIDEAYEKGDKDVVGCFEAGKKNCLRINNFEIDKNMVTTIICSLLIVVVYIIKSNKDKEEILERIANKKDKR